MSNVLDHREKAIKELESILVASGWQDSWGIFPNGKVRVQTYERDYTKPLFFKNSSPVVDDKFDVTIDGVTKILYSLYSITSMNTQTASNFANSSSVNVGFTIYSSEKYEGYDIDPSTQTADTIFNAFGTDLLTNLQKKQWGISFLGEDAMPATEGGEDYWYRQLFIFNKIFY